MSGGFWILTCILFALRMRSAGKLGPTRFTELWLLWILALGNLGVLVLAT